MAVGVMVKAPGKVVNKTGQRGAQAAQRLGEAVARHEPRQRRMQAADQCLRATRAELLEVLQPEELSARHLFVLTQVMAHIEFLEAMMARFEKELLDGIRAWQPQLVLLQTIPGIDAMGAAMLLVEIGPDMASFGNAQRLASWVSLAICVMPLALAMSPSATAIMRGSWPSGCLA